ncbi:MAG: pyrroline-5-carboxylate reductase [Lachnospiraceae bacterium]|nr:pyrroline-5-carboxylate reductase [Lachnospiraceae bacterium]
MNDYKVGFIGCGNMGGAILKGILSAGLYNSKDITVSVGNKTECVRLTGMYKVAAGMDNVKVAGECDILFLAVKPNILYNVIAKIRGAVHEKTLIVSIAAGQSIEKIEAAFGHPIKLIRVMPNVNAMADASMSGYTGNKSVTKEDLKTVADILESFGKAEEIPESLMDTVTGLSGSSPAFVFQFIEALADGAVAEGMPRDKAYTFAAQTVFGSAKLMLESEKHPAELKDMVCSPGGTTIEGVAKLEEKGFRDAVISAVRAATAKSRSL